MLCDATRRIIPPKTALQNTPKTTASLADTPYVLLSTVHPHPAIF